MYRLDVKLVGANSEATVITDSEQVYYENYYTDKARGVAHTYQAITYKNIYRHIDWKLYISDGTLEYDFIVHPGGNPDDIHIQYNGATGIDAANEKVTIKTPQGTLTEGNIYAYEQATKKAITATYRLSGNMLSYRLPHNSRISSITYIIDPTLVWGTYFGGSSSDAGAGIACDNTGNIYNTGGTNSSNNIATVGAFQSSYKGNQDIYLAKFSTGGALLWSTYYGGNGDDFAQGVCKDVAGNVYIAGSTSSDTNVSTTGSWQPEYGGGYTDGLIAKFTAGGELVWATYYGGDSEDYAAAIVCDSASNLYVSGGANSLTNIASLGAHQDSNGGAYDLFLIKFDSGGHREWGTYYGGNGMEYAYNQLSLYNNRYIYLPGATKSTSQIATAGAWQSALQGASDACLAKFNIDGALIWGTYYGGEALDNGAGACTDNAGNVYLCGGTNSMSGIATASAYQPVLAGNQDAFLAKFDSGGSLQWGTYYGGGNADAAFGLACDGGDEIFITGRTTSSDGISTAGSYQPTFGGEQDGFLSQFTATGNHLVWGTYYGGAGGEVGLYIEEDKFGNIFMTGSTTSDSGIATGGSLHDTIGGHTDAFIAKFGNFSSIVPNVANSDIQLKVYPNPNNGTFTVSSSIGNAYGTAMIHITDALGNDVYDGSATILDHKVDHAVSLLKAAPGLYAISVYAGMETRTINFIITQ